MIKGMSHSIDTHSLPSSRGRIHGQGSEAVRWLAAIIENSDDAIVSKDLNGIISTWNEGARMLFGYTADDIVGKPITLLIPDDRMDEELEILARIQKGERIRHYETIRKRKDGSLVEISLTVSPIKNLDGKVIGASKIARDITASKRAQEALKQAREAAESANRAKDRFLAVLSHELRTPLTPVLMAATALESHPALPTFMRSDIEMIRRGVELETKLIDDLLDMSRIVSGKLQLRVDAVDLNLAIQQACDICRPQILEKQIRLHKTLAADAGFVSADPARLQQMLWNILRNAAKFTPAGGGIFVCTERMDDGLIRTTVRDTGVGIEPDFLPKVFNAFEQGQNHIGPEFGGLGLGLAICRALAEAHHGRILAGSDGAGKGSTFVLDLPLAPARAGTEGGKYSAKEDACAIAIRILVAEDHRDTAALLERILKASGYIVATAHTAEEALTLAKHDRFDILISDIGLSDSTGYELIRKLSEIHPIKGIAMSGYGMDEDIKRSLAAGFAEHLTKPVSVQTLEIAIRRVLCE